MSWMEYITKHCAICQIKLLRPRGCSPSQLIQVSKRIHSDLNQICNVIYTRGQFPSRVPLDVRKIKGPYNPKLFMILGTGDLGVLYKLLANVKGVIWDSQSKEREVPAWDLSTKLFDTDTSPKDTNLRNALLDLYNDSFNPQTLQNLKFNDREHLKDTISSYTGRNIPLNDSARYAFKWNDNNLGNPTLQQLNHHSYSTEPDLILWEPQIFTNLHGLPNDMKLWLRDMKYSEDLNELLNLKPKQNDQLDILLHGFKGL